MTQRHILHKDPADRRRVLANLIRYLEGLADD